MADEEKSLAKALELMGDSQGISGPICTPEGIFYSGGSGLTMQDFADCLMTDPEFGEVGYVGDYPQPLEYPCNCSWCTYEYRQSMFLSWLKQNTGGVYGDD